MTIREKLNAIQTELIAPKNQKNKFGGYAFRSAEDILEALKPLLKKYKVVLTLSDSVEFIGDRYYIEVKATLLDTESETQISTTAQAREPENKKGFDESQITGAASSYARKYALNGLFGIDDTKDADATNNHAAKPAAKKPAAKKDEPKQVSTAIKTSMLKAIGEGKYALVEKKLGTYADSVNKKAVEDALSNAKNGE